MPKNSTQKIQNFLLDLGNELGFESHLEYSFEFLKSFGNYCPRYDVVWILNLEKFKFSISPLNKYFEDTNWFNLLKKVPIATFEIEGSTTTSKNQVGNFSNLLLSPSFYNFMIVNNAGASNENDTYRRGVKICRTLKSLYKHKNLIFADWSQIKNIQLSKRKSDKILFKTNNKNNTKGAGGETKSNNIRNIIYKDFLKTNLSIIEDYTPDIFEILFYRQDQLIKEIQETNSFDFYLGKKSIWNPTSKEIKHINNYKSFYYCPKIDICLGFNLPSLFIDFLYKLAINLEQDVINYELLYFIKEKKIDQLFFPYLGCEIESSSNKHMIGGILNSSNYFFTGLLVSRNDSTRIFNSIKKQLGISNIFNYQLKF